MKKIGFLLFGLVFMTSCSEAQTETKSPSKTTTTTQQTQVNKVVAPAEFKQLLAKEGRQLVDVRTADEYNNGHIDNAVNIDFYSSNFKAQMAKLDKSKPVLIYCHSGGRSGKTAAMLKEMGFKEVYDLRGGFSSWPY